MLKSHVIALSLIAILGAQAPTTALASATLEEVCPECVSSSRGASILRGEKVASGDELQEEEAELDEAPKAKKSGKWNAFKRVGGKVLRGAGHAGSAVGATVFSVAHGTVKFGNGIYKGVTDQDAKRAEREAKLEKLRAAARAQGMSEKELEEISLVVPAKQQLKQKFAKGTNGAISAYAGGRLGLAVAGGSTIASAGLGILAGNTLACGAEALHQRPGEHDEGAERTGFERYCDQDREIVMNVVNTSEQVGDRSGKKVGKWIRQMGGGIKSAYAGAREKRRNEHESRKKEGLEEVVEISPAALEAAGLGRLSRLNRAPALDRPAYVNEAAEKSVSVDAGLPALADGLDYEAFDAR